jgi:hypothetical protein
MTYVVALFGFALWPIFWVRRIHYFNPLSLLRSFFFSILGVCCHIIIGNCY